MSFLSARPLVSVPLLAAVTLSAAIHLVAVLVPALRPIFKTFPMTGAEWLLLLGLAALIVPAVEAAKVVYRRLEPEDAEPPSSQAPSARGA
jgi:Ca2+-transporting ATPase